MCSVTHSDTKIQGKVTGARTRCSLSHTEQRHKRTFQAFARTTCSFDMTLVWERKVGKPPRPGPHRSSPGLVRETNERKKVKRTAFMTFPSPGMNHMVGKFRRGGILCRVLKKEQKKSPWVFFLEAPSSFHKYPKRLSAPRQAKRKPLAPGIREAATGSCAPFLSPLPLDQGE